MSEILQFLEIIFKPVVFAFTISNLFAMGLQVKMPEVIIALKNKKSIVLIFVWGWVLGPALGYLITRVIPLAKPYEVVVLLSSLAPCAPFLPLMMVKARGDVGFTGAFSGWRSGLYSLDRTSIDRGADGQSWNSRKTALIDLTFADDNRSSRPELCRYSCNENLTGGQCLSQVLYIRDDCGGFSALWPADARNSGQFCPPRCDNFHGRDSIDNVSIWFRAETESAKRYGTGYGNA